MSNVREGGCQCGGIRYQIEGDPIALAICHCTDCQQQSGSAFGMSLIVPQAAFRVTLGEPRSFTKQADSGNETKCFFCGDCGVRIYHSPSAMGTTYNVKPGTLDERSWLRPSVEVWTSSKQPWVAVPEGLRAFETQPA